MEPISGIVNLNKPPGITSARALYKVRSISGIRKSGHAGTLDPAAEGVLVICIARATKLVELVMAQPKLYRATARLDVTSESFDSDRAMTEVRGAVAPTRREIEEALERFEGTIQQVPPAVSAIKIGGVPAYKLVRENKKPVLKPRPVTIHWTHLHSYDWPTIDFELACGRGTYVRALIRDLGASLKIGGCLTSLTRLAVGPFRITDAWSLSRLETSIPEQYILPVDSAAVSALHQRPALIPSRPRPA